jgi:large subunit ribosomal protein L13
MKTTITTYVIDAKGKRLGVVATEAASILLGKKNPAYARNVIEPVRITIRNAAVMDVSEKKLTEKFQTYSGYPGGRREETTAHLSARRGWGEVVRRTVSGMLPRNKHKKQLLKQLIIEA